MDVEDPLAVAPDESRRQHAHEAGERHQARREALDLRGERGVEVFARRERPGDLMVHLRRAGEGGEVGTFRRDSRVGGERAVDFAAVHLEELGEDDIGQVATPAEFHAAAAVEGEVVLQLTAAGDKSERTVAAP